MDQILGSTPRTVHLHDLNSHLATSTFELQSGSEWVNPEFSISDQVNGEIGDLALIQYTKGSLAIAVLAKGHVKVFQLDTGKEMSWDISKEAGVTSLVLTPDQTSLSTTTPTSIAIWDAQTGTETKRVGYTERITCHAYSANGNLVALGAVDGAVSLWNRSTGKINRLRGGHTEGVHCVAWAVDDRRFVTGGLDGKILFWDSQTKAQFAQPKESAPGDMALAFSSDGKTLASAGWDPTIKLWNWSDLTEEPVELKGHTLYVSSFIFCHKTRTLISASVDRTIKFWDLENGSLRFTIRGCTNVVERLALSNDDTVLASGGRYGILRLHRIATEEAVKASGWYEKSLTKERRSLMMEPLPE